MSSRVRPPTWWLKLVGKVPQLEIPGLTPRQWTQELARKWIDAIPAKCPFEKEWRVAGVLVLYIPPLCPLNPISTQLYRIRIEAQAYLDKMLRESKDPG
jgi:hypothetical protein